MLTRKVRAMAVTMIDPAPATKRTTQTPMNLHDHRLGRAAVIVCSLVLLCVASSSCKKDGLLPNEREGKDDLSVFIFSQIAKYGGSNVVSSGTTSGLTNYVYSEDKDGFQIVCKGNKVAALQSLFQAHFGNPVLSATNASGLSSFVYAVHQTGLAINCGLDSGMVDGTKQEVTQLVAVKPGALR